jgi:hypothetical protein
MVHTKRRTWASVSTEHCSSRWRGLEYATYAGFHIIGIAESNAPVLVSGNRGGAIRACWDDSDLWYRIGRGERLCRLWRGDGTI